MAHFLNFSTGDIVENRYTAARGSVVCFIPYPPELQVILEDGDVISAHADDWFIVCPIADSLALSSFNGRGPRSRGMASVHA